MCLLRLLCCENFDYTAHTGMVSYQCGSEYVSFEITLMSKSPNTVITLVRLLTGASPQVDFKIALVFKCLHTVITLESYKGANMSLEGSQCRAYSAAAITLKRACVVTSLNMSLDLSNCFTGFTAEKHRCRWQSRYCILASFVPLLRVASAQEPMKSFLCSSDSCIYPLPTCRR